MKRRFLATAVLASILWPVAADATSVVRFSFDNLCGSAVQIAHVVCLGSRTLPPDGTSGIRTETRFRVMEPVKGLEKIGEFALTLPGGEWDGRRVSVPGVPLFTEGEELVLFLSEADNAGSPWPMGLNQGCYRVTADAAGKRAVRLQHGVTPIPNSAAFKPGSGQPYNVELTDFLAEVRAVAGAPKPVTRR